MHQLKKAKVMKDIANEYDEFNKQLDNVLEKIPSDFKDTMDKIFNEMVYFFENHYVIPTIKVDIKDEYVEPIKRIMTSLGYDVSIENQQFSVNIGNQDKARPKLVKAEKKLAELYPPADEMCLHHGIYLEKHVDYILKDMQKIIRHHAQKGERSIDTRCELGMSTPFNTAKKQVTKIKDSFEKAGYQIDVKIEEHNVRRHPQLKGHFNISW